MGKVVVRIRYFHTSYDQDGTFKLVKAKKYVRNPDGTIKMVNGKRKREKIAKPTQQFYLDYTVNGKRRTKYLDIYNYPHTSPTEKKNNEKKAYKYAEKLKNEIDNNLLGLIPDDRNAKDFFDYCTEYMKRYPNKDLRKVSGAVKHLRKAMQSRFKMDSLIMGQFGEKHAEGFKKYLLRDSQLSGETPLAYFKKIKAIAKEAAQDRYIEKNPFANVDSRGLSKQRDLKKMVLTPEELQLLFNTKCGSDFVERAFIFACYTGLGMAELRVLEWSQIKKGYVNYTRSKTNVSVKVPYHPAAQRMLFGIPQTDSKVFGSFDIPSDTAINKVLNTWVKRAGIDKHITFYCARHTFATLALRQGTNLLAVAKLLGHKSLSFVQVYAQILEDEKQNVVLGIPDITSSGSR